MKKTSRRTLLHAPEMEDDISHIESHPITVHEIFSWIFSASIRIALYISELFALHIL